MKQIEFDGLLRAAEAMFEEDFGGRIFAHRRMIGRPISHPDAQIAAIVLTRPECGLNVIDPWSCP